MMHLEKQNELQFGTEICLSKNHGRVVLVEPKCPSIPGFLSSFAVADKAQKNQDKAPENQAESCSKGDTSGDTFDPLKSEENDMDPVAIANMVFSMFPNVSTDIIDELLKANDFDINLTVDMLDELSSQYTLHDDAEDINDLHDGQGDNYHHAKVSESSSNPNQDLQNEKSSAGRACFLLDQQMNPPTELGARSLFDGMPQSASVAGGDDLISALPDVLLHHVLGFLDAREAVRTCVIAKRWCHLWKSISVVRVTCDGSVQLHRKFLDHLLLLHDCTNLEVCLFDFDHYTIADVPYFDLLIQHALLCQVWELSLSVFDDDRLDAEELWMQNVHLTSQYLTKLKLDGLCLPNKFLDFSSCPALRDLNMIDCDIRADKIYSRSLEHLSMDGCVFRFDCGTLISTPSVISLQLNECLGKAVLFEDMPVLVRATVTLIIWCFDYCESDDPGYCDNASCWRCYSTDDGRAGCVFLKGLSAARTLELIAEPKVFIFGRDLRWCPTFSKLKSLLLGEWCVAGDHRALICILQHSRVLEMLTLELDEKARNMVPSKAIYNLLNQPLPPENLQRVKVICYKIDQRVHSILKSLITYGVPLGKISIHYGII